MPGRRCDRRPIRSSCRRRRRRRSRCRRRPSSRSGRRCRRRRRQELPPSEKDGILVARVAAAATAPKTPPPSPNAASWMSPAPPLGKPMEAMSVCDRLPSVDGPPLPEKAFISALPTTMPPATPAAVVSAPRRKPPPAGACLLGLAAPRAALLRLGRVAALRLAAPRSALLRAAAGRSRAAGRGRERRRLGLRRAAPPPKMDDRKPPPPWLPGLLLQLLVLGLGLFELLVEALHRLFLHVERLRHRVGRVGLGAHLVGDEALGLGVARLPGRLLEPLEDVGDDLSFLVVHVWSPLKEAGWDGRADMGDVRTFVRPSPSASAVGRKNEAAPLGTRRGRIAKDGRTQGAERAWKRVEVAGLEVAESAARLRGGRGAAGHGRSAGRVLDRASPRSCATSRRATAPCSRTRDALQAQIDAWHRERGRRAHRPGRLRGLPARDRLSPARSRPGRRSTTEQRRRRDRHASPARSSSCRSRTPATR